MMDLGAAISVPTGKTTPIEPAVPEPKIIPVPGSYLAPPAPVQEYSEERPEPPPLDPSYVPIPYNFIEYLAPQSLLLVTILFLQRNNVVTKLMHDRYENDSEDN